LQRIFQARQVPGSESFLLAINCVQSVSPERVRALICKLAQEDLCGLCVNKLPQKINKSPLRSVNKQEIGGQINDRRLVYRTQKADKRLFLFIEKSELLASKGPLPPSCFEPAARSKKHVQTANHFLPQKLNRVAPSALLKVRT